MIMDKLRCEPVTYLFICFLCKVIYVLLSNIAAYQNVNIPMYTDT